MLRGRLCRELSIKVVVCHVAIELTAIINVCCREIYRETERKIHNFIETLVTIVFKQLGRLDRLVIEINYVNKVNWIALGGDLLRYWCLCNWRWRYVRSGEGHWLAGRSRPRQPMTHVTARYQIIYYFRRIH